MFEVAADFYPKRVYCYPYLINLIKQIYDYSLRNYAEIVNALLKSTSRLVFITCLENKESYFLMRDQHMSLILLAGANYNCTSKSNDDFFFDELTVKGVLNIT